MSLAEFERQIKLGHGTEDVIFADESTFGSWTDEDDDDVSQLIGVCNKTSKPTMAVMLRLPHPEHLMRSEVSRSTKPLPSSNELPPKILPMQRRSWRTLPQKQVELTSFVWQNH